METISIHIQIHSRTTAREENISMVMTCIMIWPWATTQIVPSWAVVLRMIPKKWTSKVSSLRVLRIKIWTVRCRATINNGKYNHNLNKHLSLKYQHRSIRYFRAQCTCSRKLCQTRI